MNLYTAPVAGTYNYRTRNFNGSFNLFQVKVNIIGESLKSYLVEVLTPIAGHKRLSRLTVRKHNVFLKDAGASTGSATDKDNNIDCGNAWWYE